MPADNFRVLAICQALQGTIPAGKFQEVAPPVADVKQIVASEQRQAYG
jgi:hypothetical protein